MKHRNIVLTAITILSFGMALHAESQSISSIRAAGEQQLKQYANKSFIVTGRFERSYDPAWFSNALDVTYRGCPAVPLTSPTETVTLSFSSGQLGPWVGDIDGMNLRLRSALGETGSSIAIPPVVSGESFKLEFTFDQTLNTERALIDRIAREIDKCFADLPPGEFDPKEVLAQCKIPVVEREQVGQTCVLVTSGTLTSRSSSENAFDALLNIATMCDFVGMGGSGEQNTGFTTCFSQQYVGTATLAPEKLGATAGVALRRTIAQSHRRCRAKRSTAKKMACTMRALGRRL